MRFFGMLSLVFLALPLAAQTIEGEPINSLIAKLGSNSFKEREAAAKALRQRPDAERALRAALGTLDLEASRRAVGILDYFDRAPLRELHSAAQDGRITRVVEVLGHWPAGKYEEEIWQELGQFANIIQRLHRKGGGRFNQAVLWDSQPTRVVSQSKIGSATTGTGENGRTSFLRAGKAELISAEVQIFRGTIVAASSVRICHDRAELAVFAGGSVEADGTADNVLIVSCGDTNLNGYFRNSLIISKGKINCPGRLTNSCVISSGVVTFGKPKNEHAINCVITENDPNPLGFIRWSDAPQEKAGPKAK